MSVEPRAQKFEPEKSTDGSPLASFLAHWLLLFPPSFILSLDPTIRVLD